MVPRKDPTHFVYGSAPNRGLEQVLEAWPLIRAGVPTATLAVYYGFSDAFMKFGRSGAMGAHFEDRWLPRMKRLLRQPGVEYVGMVDHSTLAKGYAAAGLVLYPTAFPETGCVTLMKAQAMGALPVTSRFAGSTLPELTEPFDLGPPRALGVGEDPWGGSCGGAPPDPLPPPPLGNGSGGGGGGGGDESRLPGAPPPRAAAAAQPGARFDAGGACWGKDWAAAVVATSLADARGELREHRRAMVAAARERFLWAHVAKLWDGHFQ